MAEKRTPWWKAVPEGAATAAEAAPAPTASGDLDDGESLEVKGSGANTYTLRNVAGTYSCSCPAWRNQGAAIEKRTCKHLRALRGNDAEDARIGSTTPRERASANRTADSPSQPGVAPPLLLAHSWENDVDLAGWWMSEKLDGVRAFWDGANFISRLGNVFVAPDWFIERLPKDMALDGELFGGRGKFQRTVSIVRRQDKSNAWREIQYVVFDAPKLPLPFEERLAAVRERLAALDLAHVLAHPHEPCRDVPHLKEELARVESLGGEGLMMRRPGSRYEVGRSYTLLKVKSFKDAEAKVVEYGPGLGKHVGRVGALICELPNGKRFNVGTGLSNEERAKPPPIGTIITFRYQELTNDGIPRFPSYVGVRADAAWPAGADAGARGQTPSPSQTSSSGQERGPQPEPPKRREAPASSRALVGAGVSGAEPPTMTTRDARVFVRDGTTWEIRLAGNMHVIRRVRGEAVESLTTTFTGGALAWRDAERRISEQLENGFVEVSPDD